MARHDRTLTTAAAGFAGVLLAIAVPAGIARAHIDPDPPEAPAGSTLPVGFTVQHGCGESPTVQLDMRLPEGASDATPVPPDGWSGEVTETDDGETVVSFSGGPLPADVEGTFTVEVTLPATPDVTVYFPFVQRCVDGEIRWIDIPEDGSGDELDEPAPAMRLTAPVVTTAPDTTGAASTTSTGAGTTTADTTAPTQDPSTTASPTTDAPTTPEPPTSTEEPPATEAITAPPANGSPTADEDDDGSDTGLIVAIVAAAVAVIGGGAAWIVRRNRV